MAFKLSSLCLALSLGLSNYAMASCNGIGDGASATLEGVSLRIAGSAESESFSFNTSQDTLTVTRTASSNTSCDTFYLSQIMFIEARLGAGNDTFNGQDVAVMQYVYGENGNDTITTGSQQDRVYGGAGNDTIYGRAGNDMLHGQDGSDVIYGGYGNDHITGGNDHDQLFGDQNDDVIVGDNGGDLLIGGQGSDLLMGGNDNDYLGGGCRLANANNGYIYEQSGCNSNSDGGDTLYGGSGDDVLSGDKGNDKLYGEDGDDYLTGNKGREDRLYGGNGKDALFEVGDGDVVNSSKWHKAWGNGGDDILFTYLENSRQEGGSGNDVIITSSTEFDAKIQGGRNADYIWTADAFPEGSCGKGDDKGVLFLNSCEGITWVDDYQGLLSKVDKKSNFDNPYYDAANAVVEMPGSYTGLNNGWRSYGPRPTALFDIVSSAVFQRWLEDQSTKPYSYYEWRVDYNVGSGIYGTYINCMENNVAYKCKHILQQVQTCYNQTGSVVDCQ
ncbi:MULTISPECIES: calcium-binding protein [Pseudoalteromonas]|uniref:Sodium:calcium exchanger n=1 Tax=Pseudoalteromonas amylolytica TaxID=1859457 RepID=A0A1S1MPZ9_9GAMM|nr:MULTISPECIES: calcium-binding protein [Pseudoalteromonas]OHU88453.1 sodium:calcium exchanger [Pseudoalteromonas sp. JW3]OHU90296.1 sodium:calcium exchanger [Pseudoalteromonas amylolytica]